MIYCCYNSFDKANETNIYEIKSRRRRSQILTRFSFLVLFFLKNQGFIQEGNPSEKVVIVEEEPDGIYIDEIGNLEDSLRFVLIDEEYENLMVVNYGGELTRNINQKKKSGVLQ